MHGPDDPASMRRKVPHSEILRPYLALSYLLLLLNASVYLRHHHYTDALPMLFSVAVYLSYSFLYLLPVILVLSVINISLSLPLVSGFLSRINIDPPWVLYIPAVLLTWILQVMIYADGFIFRFYSFHINGFVWNLVFTPGGIESMGGDVTTFASFGAIAFGFFILQLVLLVLLRFLEPIRRFCLGLFNRRFLALSSSFLLLLMALQSVVYGVANLYAYTPVMNVSDDFPLYVPLTFKRLARSVGVEPEKKAGFQFNQKTTRICYPLAPIQEKTQHHKYNIVWLVGESLRSDMMNPEVMPETWAFSRKAVCFANHYGSSNGTRQSLFSMFYGLYGNYWFSFLKERRGPVVMDVLLRQGYQINLFSSARFSYPEFNKTVFAQVPETLCHDLSELPPGQGWQHDRENVTRMLDFLDRRDKKLPFMTFIFFESPHARYYFPPESIIRKPYLEDFNYATMNPNRDMPLIKNRYINSCHHLDSQYGRVIRYLEEHDLLDSTIVILTGDHGEEFMEKGHWGHNSSFVEEQIRTPLVLWVPGLAPRQVNRITSHVDIPATLMPLLGVTTPVERYTHGSDLLAPQGKPYTIMADWHALAYLDGEYKAVFGYNGMTMNKKVTTKNDMVVEDQEGFYRSRGPIFLEIMKELGRFNK